MIWIFVMVLGLNLLSQHFPHLNTSFYSPSQSHSLTHAFNAYCSPSHSLSQPLTTSHNLSLPLSLPHPQSSPPVLGRHVLHASAEKLLQRLRDGSPSSADSPAQQGDATADTSWKCTGLRPR